MFEVRNNNWDDSLIDESEDLDTAIAIALEERTRYYRAGVGFAAERVIVVETIRSVEGDWYIIKTRQAWPEV